MKFPLFTPIVRVIQCSVTYMWFMNKIKTYKFYRQMYVEGAMLDIFRTVVVDAMPDNDLFVDIELSPTNCVGKYHVSLNDDITDVIICDVYIYEVDLTDLSRFNKKLANTVEMFKHAIYEHNKHKHEKAAWDYIVESYPEVVADLVLQDLIPKCLTDKNDNQ